MNDIKDDVMLVITLLIGFLLIVSLYLVFNKSIYALFF